MVSPTRSSVNRVSAPTHLPPSVAAYAPDESALRSRTIVAKYTQVVGKLRRLCLFISTWLVVSAILQIYFVTAVFSNEILFLSYYAVNYRFGFVRRGLAGELIHIFPFADYFTVAHGIIW